MDRFHTSFATDSVVDAIYYMKNSTASICYSRIFLVCGF